MPRHIGSRQLSSLEIPLYVYMVLAWPKDLAVEHLTQHCTFLFAIAFLALFLVLSPAKCSPTSISLHSARSCGMGSTSQWALQPIALSRLSCTGVSHLTIILPVQHPALSCYSAPQLQLLRTQWCLTPICDCWCNLNPSVPSQKKVPQCELFTCTSFSILLPTILTLLYFNRSKINKY